MKQRIDFVSNSSSSSFICYAKEDTFFNEGNRTVLNYDEMMHYIRYDFLFEFDNYKHNSSKYSNWGNDRTELKEKWLFIPDEKYIKDFGCNHEEWTMPESLKDFVFRVCDSYEEYLKFYTTTSISISKEEAVAKKKKTDELWEKYSNEENHLYKKLKELLRPAYGNEKYHMNSYSDHVLGWHTDKSGHTLDSEESMMKDFSKAKLTFKKVVNNH